MKRIFYLFILISSYCSAQNTGTSSLVSGLGRQSNTLTTYTSITPSDTITFNAGALLMSFGKISRNHTFTTINANNTQNTSQVVVTLLPDTTHSITIDTSAATGFNVVGFPDSLHPNKFIFQWFGNGLKPLCTINIDNNTVGFIQKYYSDSLRNNANDVITITNADHALTFGANAPFTLGYWVKIFAGSQHTVFIRVESGDNPIISDISSAGYPQLRITDSLGNYIWDQATDLAIFSGGWHYILETYSGSKDTSGLAIYVDGVKSTAGTKTKSGTLQTTYIGTNNAQFMSGASAGAYNFDQWFIASGVLTTGQIAEAYNANNHYDIGGATFYGSVVAWYPWINQQFTDFTGNGHTLTATSHNFSLDFK